MSYFLFGFVGGLKESFREQINLEIEVQWGEPFLPGVTMEMLSLCPEFDSDKTPFFIVKVGDDNASSLVSPYEVSQDDLISNVVHMVSWVNHARVGQCAEIWISEGYDDSFRTFKGDVDKVCQQVADVIKESGDLPSMRIVIP